MCVSGAVYESGGSSSGGSGGSGSVSGSGGGERGGGGATSSGGGSGSAAASASESTTVVYNFHDDAVPFVIRVPTRPVTLKRFKQHLPKKGNYRFVWGYSHLNARDTHTHIYSNRKLVLIFFCTFCVI